MKIDGCEETLLKEGFVLDDKYEILSVIGRGSTSTVYLAMHQRLRQKWAIKEVNKEYCENYGMICRQLIAEANILKELDHPGLPKIVDIIEQDNTIWLVMEFIEGITLKKLLEEKDVVEEKQAVEWGMQICKIFSYLHSRVPPIIYRDLKPENLIIKRDGRLMLIDFGTAREYCYGSYAGDTSCLGTRGYAAPEQYGGMGQTDARTDIYCFGVMLYYLLTGHNPERPPFKMYPTNYWEDKVSSDMKEIILTCTQWEAADRYQSCEEIYEAFTSINDRHRFHEKKEKEKIKIFLVIMTAMFICGLSFLSSGYVLRYYEREAAIAYMVKAQKSVEEKEAENAYRRALELAPGEVKVYDSLLEYFVRPNDFSTEDATILTNLLMTETKGESVLHLFKKKNTKEYGEFCYSVGIGYFYDMGGFTGKRLAKSWFCDTEQIKSKKFDKEKRKRAGLYADICGYYSHLLKNGGDKSGERKTESFYDFYKTLHRLNQIKINKKSSDSDLAAAWLISKEVAIEITNYGEDFLNNEKISEEMLEEELDIIKKRMDILKKIKEKELNELEELIGDAERRIAMLSSFKSEGDGENGT